MTTPPRSQRMLATCALLLGLAFPPLHGADRPTGLAVQWIDGQPHVQVTGTPGRWVQLLHRSSLESRSRWQSLGYVILGQDPVLIADRSGLDAAHYYTAATATSAPPADLVWISAGGFVMGSPASEEGRDLDEGPQHEVNLTSGFWIGRHEVTQAEYQTVMGLNPSQAADDTSRPVEQVSWDDAHDYCDRLTARELAAGRIPPGFAFRLPTEAEWEYAARAGTTTRFSHGDDPGYTELPNVAWFADNSAEVTHPVGLKKPNPWGLHDAAGNVWEWCLDFYGAYAAGAQTNPKGPGSGTERVVRGGSYYYDAWLSRSAARNSFRANTRSFQVGFRVVLALQ